MFEKAEERLRISSRKKKDKKIEFLEKKTISEMTEWEKQQIRYNKRKKCELEYMAIENNLK